MTTTKPSSLDRPNLLARFIKQHETIQLDNAVVTTLTQRTSDQMLLALEDQSTQETANTEQYIDKLIQSLQENPNDEKTYEAQLELISIYIPLIEAIVDNLILNPEDRDDLIQIAVLNLLSCIDKYQTGNSFTNYILRAIFNSVSRAQIHKSTKFNTNYKPIPRNQVLETTTELSSEEEDLIFLKQIRETFEANISKLLDLKEELVLRARLGLLDNRYLEDITRFFPLIQTDHEKYQEILIEASKKRGQDITRINLGKILGISDTMVKNVLDSAIEKLQTKKLEEHENYTIFKDLIR